MAGNDHTPQRTKYHPLFAWNITLEPCVLEHRRIMLVNTKSGIQKSAAVPVFSIPLLLVDTT